jgi:hypothetical protein
LGFAGSGKTYTAALVAIGLSKMLNNKKPVFFIDTETGSDFMVRRFKTENLGLFVVKKRAFKDLLPMCEEAEKNTDILIVDSVSAFWGDLMESYKAKKGRTFISFPDWGILKREWQKFTDWYLNAPVHCIICGRAGWIYNPMEDADGQTQLEKIGTKMKAEAEFGYEPSILIEMERIKLVSDGKIGEKIVHRAHILKDRNDILDGKSFDDPTFKDFLPTIEALNLGGEHFGLDTKTTSEEMFDSEGRPQWKIEQEQCAILLEEIQNEIVKVFPSQSAGEKRAKINLLEFVFQTSSWNKISEMKSPTLKEGLAKIKALLENADAVGELQKQKPDLNWFKFESPGAQ